MTMRCQEDPMGDHTQKMAFLAEKDHKKTHSAAAERAQMIWRDLVRALTVGHLDHVPGLGTSSVLMVFLSAGATLLISSAELVRAAAERAQMIWGDLARALTVGHLDHVPGLGTSLVLMVF